MFACKYQINVDQYLCISHNINDIFQNLSEKIKYSNTCIWAAVFMLKDKMPQLRLGQMIYGCVDVT